MPHLTEGVRERYLLDLASESEIAELEEHLQVCDDCCSRLLETERSLRILREALKEATAPVVATHETPVGAVGLLVRPDPAGNWIARILGPGLLADATLPSREAAEDRCRRTFDEMYSDHSCTARCRIHPAWEPG